VDVTQKVVMFMDALQQTHWSGRNITLTRQRIGKKFLEEHGYKNMVDTYYLKEDNTAIIIMLTNKGCCCISRPYKSKIALDNGEVIGFESKGYLSNHTERNIPAPKLTLEEARSKISSRMQVLSSGLAIIPTDYKTELFTYEFKGKLNDKDFLVYINAETGKRRISL